VSRAGSELDRKVAARVTAETLQPRVGQTLEALVIDVRPSGLRVLADGIELDVPLAALGDGLRLGRDATALCSADGSVGFNLADALRLRIAAVDLDPPQVRLEKA
jgi:exoribonuclease R